MTRSYPSPASRGCRAAVSLAVLTALLALPAASASAASSSPFARDEVLVHYRGDPGAKRVSVPAGDSVDTTLSKLRRDPAVGYAQPDYLVKAAAFSPNDPGSPGPGGWARDQWNFLSPGTVTGGISIPAAWRQLIHDGHPGGKGVTVAVVDSGVAYRDKGRRYRKDPDLPATRRFVHPKDLIDGDHIPLDREGHGTHVTSTIVQSTNNRFGLTGIAYGVKIMPIRVLNRQDTGKGSDVARGVRYATRHGADIINLSLEFEPDVRHCSQVKVVCDAIQAATDQGVLVVASAGNHDNSHVAYPAAAPGALAVGATTYRGCDADYSDYGADLDLVAPGGGADRTVAQTHDRACRPRALGYEIRQYSLLPSATRRGNYRKFGIVGHRGTSMAAAHVSGVAALVLADGLCGTSPTPDALTQRLEATAIDRGLRGRDDFYGHGLVNAAFATNPALPCPST
jgi:serine protease